MMRLGPHEKIDIGTAERRALRALRALRGTPLPASCVATRIWPGHSMTAQGAGGAASRVLKRLARHGLARWTSGAGVWGWVASDAGLAQDDGGEENADG